MGLVKLFTKPSKAKLDRLPSGTFTVDARGDIVTSTIPQWFSADRTHDIASQVLATFRSAQEAQLHISELVIHYAGLKITARYLRGGAIVFLVPKTLQSNLNT